MSLASILKRPFTPEEIEAIETSIETLDRELERELRFCIGDAFLERQAVARRKYGRAADTLRNLLRG